MVDNVPECQPGSTFNVQRSTIMFVSRHSHLLPLYRSILCPNNLTHALITCFITMNKGPNEFSQIPQTANNSLASRMIND